MRSSLRSLLRMPAVGICAALLWGAAGLFFGVRLAGKAADDFFITYRYAQNLAAGEGFVFNPGERVFGTTEPGLGLALAALHAATRIPIPVLGTLLTGVAAAAIAGALLGEQRRPAPVLACLAGGTLVLTSSFLWAHQGAAAPLALALLLLACRIAGQRPWLAGALAGFAVWCRPDAALGLALLVVLIGWEERAVPWRLAAGAALVVLVGAACAWAYFGTPLPHTLAAKQTLASAAAAPGEGPPFWDRALPLWKRHGGLAAAWIAGLAAAGLVPLFAHAGRTGRLLAGYAATLAVAYPLLGVGYKSWYLLPCLFAGYYGLAFLAVWLAAFGLGARPERLVLLRPAALAAAAGLLILLGALCFHSVGWLARYAGPPRLALYREAAEWIADRSAPGDRLAHTEVGILGFYGQRPILDVAGLVTPRAVAFAARRDYRGLLAAEPVRFVLARRPRSRLQNLIASRWFEARYREAAHFSSPHGEGLRVYERRRYGPRPRADRMGTLRHAPPPPSDRPPRRPGSGGARRSAAPTDTVTGE